MKYLALLCLVVLGTGCVRGRVSYGVHPLASETIPGELNAEWFARNIYGSLEIVDKKGRHRVTHGLTAVELVYCPIVKGGAEPVCRSTVVWEAGTNAYLEASAKAP